MKTEEDTFNALRRTPFDQVFKEWAILTTFNPTDSKSVFELWLRHGWTMHDFCLEWKKHYVN